MIANGIQVLSDDDRVRLHEAALDILGRRGALVGDEQLRGEMKKRGAQDGLGAEELRFPRELVAECLASTGRRPIYRTVGGKTLELHGNHRYYGCIVTDPYIADFTEGVRQPRLSDIERHVRLGDALPLIDCIHLMDDTIPGLDSATSALRGLEAYVSNTTAAYHCAPGSMLHTRYWIEVSEIMAGGSLKRNPILGAYVPTVSPLMLTAHNTKQLRLFIERGVVVNLGPCAIAGATAPYPVAGLVAQSWAEFVLGLVASQVIEPGCPAIATGGGQHPMDMMTGESLYSGVSKALAAAAANELAAWQGLSIATGNYTTLCSNFGVQNGMEHAFGVLSTFFAPGHCWHGMGSVANACGMSPVQIVIDHDLTEVALRLQRGIDITDETLALESIVSVGPRGNFLADPLTLKYLRSDEHFFPSSYERCAGGQDVKTMAQRAHERAEDLIANHKPAVPQDRLQEVRRYVERELSRAKSGAKEED